MKTTKKPTDFSKRNIEIGGSEIAAVMGMSPFDTPLSLWAKKTGKIQADLSNFEAMEIGTELEPFLAAKFTKKTGIQLRIDNRTFKHPKYPYMIGHIDRWVVGEDAIWEGKTTSAWMEKHWDGEEIPKHFVLQVVWYLGLVGKSKGHIAVLIGGQKFRTKMVEFDKELFEAMVERAREFMEYYVAKDIAPIATEGDSDTLIRMYPQSQPTELRLEGQLAEEMDVLLDDRSGAVESINHAKEELEKIESRVKQIIGENECAETCKWKISWRTIRKASYVVKEQSYRQLRQTPRG